MATKTFKIGEYAKGGIITVETTKTQVTVIGKEWDHSTGTRRSSDQSNAQEFTRKTFNINDSRVKRELADFLCDLTTSYYAGQITDWIETKVTLYKSLYW